MGGLGKGPPHCVSEYALLLLPRLARVVRDMNLSILGIVVGNILLHASAEQALIL